MTGGGDTPQQAMVDLESAFGRMKDTRESEGKAMPRPGTKVPIEFAASNKVCARPELTEDFIQRVLELPWAFVSDESSLWDFHSDETNEVLHGKIRGVYGVDVADLQSGNLAEILERIAASGWSNASSL
jgi:hypothetical protein